MARAGPPSYISKQSRQGQGQEDVPLLDPFQEPEESHTGWSGLSCFLQCLCCPLMGGMNIVSSVVTLPVQTEAVILRWGKYEQTLKEAGIHYSNIWGRTMLTVKTNTKSMDLPVNAGNRRTVLDASGNPLIVSAVVVYKVVNSYRATVDVQNPDMFLLTQGESTLKEVVSQFPYEVAADSGQLSLRQSADEVSLRLRDLLQSRVHEAGLSVQSFRLKEITYAPVIAQAMLKQQQAAAMIAARQTIVTGAVSIATSAVSLLSEQGIVLTQQDTTQLVSNLLTVICAESDVQPTVPLGSYGR